MSDKLKIYILNNGIVASEGMSGSDQRALNWGKIFFQKGHEVNVIIPGTGIERYKGFNRLVTSNDSLKGGIGLVSGYFKRAFKGARVLNRALKKDAGTGTVVYSSSDLIPDSLPAIFNKIKSPSIRWITGLHLLAPNPFKGFKKVSTDGYALPSLSDIYYFLTQRLVIGFMKRYAHTVMVSNSDDRDFLLKRGFGADRVIVTYGAVDRTALERSKKNGTEFDSCFVGRFHRQKGFFDLIDAWKRVCKKFPKAKLAVIGNDINLENVIERVRAEGLSGNVRFMGFLAGTDKFNVMRSSKICVFPSTYESFGMVAAEAMACGLPVVAYDLPVYREVYPNGMLKAKIGDIDGLVSHINSLLSNELLRQSLSKEACELSRRFDWETTAEAIMGRLNQCAG